LRDLVRRMRRHAEEIFTARGIALEFRAPEGERMMRIGADVRRDLFLVFKEAVNNAARHSDCNKVEIELRADGAGLSLRITDDGRGFDISAETDGNGLPGMRRRAENLGGTLGVESDAARGTTVTLSIPRAAVRRSF